MTDLDLPALKKLCDAATPGPWTIESIEAVCRINGIPKLGIQNAPFVAAARTTVPELIERIEAHELIQVEITRINKELRAEVERLEKQHKWDSNALRMQIEIVVCVGGENQALRELLGDSREWISKHHEMPGYSDLLYRIDAALSTTHS